MTDLLGFLVRHGVVLLAGVTLLLGCGALGMCFSRAPAQRQRLGELTVLATLVWLPLACLPLPRPDLLGRIRTSPAETLNAPRSPAAWKEALPAAHVSPPAPNTSVQKSPPRPDAVRDAQLRAEPAVPGSAQRRAWREAFAAAYLIGAAGCLAWLAIGRLVLFRAGRVATRAEAWLSCICTSLPSGLKLDAARLLVSPRCRRPVVYGLLRPKILLPRRLCRPEHASRLRHAVLHELAHVWRGDAWGHAMFSLALPVMYWHPVYWWIRREVQFARELVADDWAARLATKESYVNDLVELVKEDGRMVPGTMGVLGVFRLRTQFYRRMKMLLDREGRLATRTSRIWKITSLSAALAMLTAGVWLIGVSPAGAGGDPGAGAVADPAPTADPAGESQGPLPGAAAPRKAPAPGQGPAGGPGQGTEGLSDPTDRAADCLPGVLSLIDDVEVAASTDGPLVEVAAEEGMQVKQGQRLARIDPDQAERRVEAVRASLEGLEVEKIKLKEAELSVQEAKRELKRLEALFKQNAVPNSQIDEARVAVERAMLRAALAETELRAGELVHRAELQAAEAALAACLVTAPIDGIVLKTYCKPGGWVRAGDPVCRIIRLDRLRVETFLDVYEHDLDELELGREVLVEVPLARNRRHRLSAKIVFVSPVVESDGRLSKFYAELESSQRHGRWLLRPGMQALVFLKAD